MKTLLASTVEVFVFLTAWALVGKFVQYVMQVEKFEWIMFWGFVAGGLALGISKIAKVAVIVALNRKRNRRSHKE